LQRATDKDAAERSTLEEFTRAFSAAALDGVTLQAHQQRAPDLLRPAIPEPARVVVGRGDEIAEVLGLLEGPGW
jgi:hypothetical protein